MADAPLGPADVAPLAATLAAALDPRTQCSAEAALDGLAGRPGYGACLLTVATDPAQPDAARWLAAVTLKNAISRGWRGRGRGAVPEQDRAPLRAALVPALLTADDARAARALAVAIARAARSDWPREWPDVVAALAAASRDAGSGAAAARAALGLHAVLKELASKRLAADAAAFSRLADDLLPALWAGWVADARAALAGGPADASSGDLSGHPLDRARLGLKCVRRLLASGRAPDARSLQPWPPVVDAAAPLVEALHAAAPARGAFALKLLKTVRELAEDNPWALLAAPPAAAVGAADVAAGLIAARRGGDAASPVDDALTTHACLLVKALVDAARAADPAEPPPPGPADRAATVRAAAAPARAALVAGPLAPERRAALADTLITTCLRLTPADAADWDADAEAFAHAAATATGSAWRSTPRGAADALVAALVADDRVGLGSALARRLADTAAALRAAAATPATTPAAATDAALAAEAAAAAATAAAYDLHDHVDWPRWLDGDLLPWLAADPAAVPACLPPRARAALARRAALALAAWTPRASPRDRARLYGALPPAIAAPDAAVALAAASALSALVDDWGFDEDAFAPHAAAAVGAAASALARAADLDSQAALFALLNAIVDRLPPDAAAAHAGPVLAALPRLWDGAGGGAAPLLRCAVAASLARVANALGPASPAAYPVLLPVLGAALDVASPDAAVLLEDGLTLWVVALRNAPPTQDAAAALLSSAPAAAAAALDTSTEHVGLVCAGTASAALLGGSAFVESGGAAPLLTALATAARAVNERGLLAILTAADAVFAAAPAAVAALDGLLLATAADALAARHTTPPLAAAAASLLARLALASPAAFVDVATRAGALAGPAAAAAAAGGTHPAAVLVDAMAAAADAAPSGGRRLIAAALADLLPAPIPGLLDRLPAVAAAVTGAWAERDAPGADPDPPPLRFAFDRSDAYAAAGPAADDGPLAASDDADGEAGRRAELRRGGAAAEPLAPRVAAAVRAAAAAHGPAFAAAAAGLDGRVSEAMNAMVASR